MKRKYIYGILGILVLSGMIWQSFSSLSHSGIKKGASPASLPSAWNNIMAENINSSPIRLSVNGSICPLLPEESVYMSSGMVLMMPITILEQIFSCTENLYEGNRLVIEKSTTRIELFKNQKTMLLNHITTDIREPMTEKSGRFYVPIDDIASALGYHLNWSVEDNQIELTAANPNASILPDSYDYRINGRVPDVKNQGDLGTCWAFASLTALETCLLPEESLIFSADNMSMNNSFHMRQNDGGEYTMSMAYLLAWQGPVLEKDDPYGDGKTVTDRRPEKHIQEIQIIPAKDYQAIKEAVYFYGGVQSSLYTSLTNYKSRSVYYNEDTYSYCYVGTEKPNHDSVIVGWDDHYPKENFNMELEGDGAFICVNSWGEQFGDNGFFYVSYYDSNIGVHNICYTGIESPDNYDSIYQSDLCGWVGQIGYGKEDAFFANVYETKEKESLEAVGFYATGAGTEYQVYVARHVNGKEDLNERELLTEGTLDYAGYYTIHDFQPIMLDAGERYAVIVSVHTPDAIHPVAIEYSAENGKTEVDLTDGEGYISLRGNGWDHVEETHRCNICLKAYTKGR